MYIYTGTGTGTGTANTTSTTGVNYTATEIFCSKCLIYFCKFDMYAESSEFSNSSSGIIQGDTFTPPHLRAHQAPGFQNLPALHNPI